MAEERVQDPTPTVSSDRRRQRGVRVTTAVSLLGSATGVVLVALPTRSALWISIASVVALALSWSGLRMMWTEILQSRRVNAADRAASAAAYRALFGARAEEHAEFTASITERLAAAHLSRRELEGRLAQEERRAVKAEAKLAEESELLRETRTRVAELEALVTLMEQELPQGADVVSWEERNAERATARTRQSKRAKPA